ncbi:hypothetical protein R3P38DRAFT_2785737 [Favolaschia claudopus]|uniref:Uncharacterized protein n=1 Tax=Favolaschia claudopus TaxID=2862362 RepID=A0AAW0ASP3_9AGAR
MSQASRRAQAPRSGPPRRAESAAQRSGSGVENPGRPGRRPKHNTSHKKAKEIIFNTSYSSKYSENLELLRPVNKKIAIPTDNCGAPRTSEKVGPGVGMGIRVRECDNVTVTVRGVGLVFIYHRARDLHRVSIEPRASACNVPAGDEFGTIIMIR